MKNIAIRKLLCLAVAAVLVLSGAALAVSAEYPYPDWALTAQAAPVEDTVSRAETVWKTLYGTATAAELEFGELRYWVYLPENYEPRHAYPLVVYLHGSDVSYQQSKYTPWVYSLNKSASRVPDVLREVLEECILFVPQAPSTKAGTVAGSGWSNMAGGEWKTATEDTTGSSNYLKATEKLMAGYMADGIAYGDSTYAVDGSRVYLIGESMGGIGAYAMLQDCPDTFAAVLVRAGIGDPNAVAAWKDTPIRIFHGDTDYNVRYESSVRMIEALNAAGAKDAQLITVEKGGHDVRKEMYRTLDEQGNNVYLTWLSQQSRPDNAVTREAAYWPLAAAAAAAVVLLAVVWFFRKRRTGQD